MYKVACADANDFIKTVPTGSVDLVLTDVPYAQEMHDRGFASKRKGSAYRESAKWSGLDVNFTNSKWLDEFARVCKKVNVAVFCSLTDALRVMNYAQHVGYLFYVVPYVKSNPPPVTNNMWLAGNEYLVHFWEKGLKPFNTNYENKLPWHIVTCQRKEHPNQKDITFCERVIKNLTQPGGVVADFFAGYGTTAFAAKNTGRQFVGCEIDKAYVDKANWLLSDELFTHF